MVFIKTGLSSCDSIGVQTPMEGGDLFAQG